MKFGVNRFGKQPIKREARRTSGGIGAKDTRIANPRRTAGEPGMVCPAQLISSLVKISRTDNHQQKRTENQRLSPFFSVREFWYLSIDSRNFGGELEFTTFFYCVLGISKATSLSGRQTLQGRMRARSAWLGPEKKRIRADPLALRFDNRFGSKSWFPCDPIQHYREFSPSRYLIQNPHYEVVSISARPRRHSRQFCGQRKSRDGMEDRSAPGRKAAQRDATTLAIPSRQRFTESVHSQGKLSVK
jgi:hypothetical protein